MNERADLADRIQQTCSGLVMSNMNQSDIGILFQSLLNNIKIGPLVYRKLQIDMGKTIELTDLNGTCGICTVVDNKDLLIRRQILFFTL